MTRGDLLKNWVDDPDILEDLIDHRLQDVEQDPLLWIMRPMMVPFLSRWLDEGIARHGTARVRAALARQSNLGNRVQIDERNVAWCWASHNQRRAFGQLIKAPDVRTLDMPGRVRRLPRPVSRRTKRLSKTLGEALGKTSWRLRLGLALLLRTAARDAAAAREAIDRAHPRMVVVATQHGMPARSVLLAARQSGIPSIYVPHAPMGDNRHYQDLPVDLAALRGPIEARAYMDLGAPDDGLVVVGDLAMDLQPSRTATATGQVIVAPSSWNPDRVRRFIEITDAALDDPFLVCPHPQSDLAYLRRILPAQATLVPGRTASVLARGARALVQDNSGVASEAMLLGVPVVQLSLGSEALYPIIREPSVRMVTSAVELRQAIGAAGSPDRGEWVTGAKQWARQWTKWTGEDASERLAAVVADDIPCRGPLLDGWALPRGDHGRSVRQETNE